MLFDLAPEPRNAARHNFRTELRFCQPHDSSYNKGSNFEQGTGDEFEPTQSFDPDFPRYLPLEPFPDYRHVPGTNMEIQGRFGHTEDPILDLPGPDAWRDNTDYFIRGRPLQPCLLVRSPRHLESSLASSDR